MQQPETERLAALRGLEDWLELPMLVLGFVWLGLLILELTGGANSLIQTLGFVIWGVFVLDFALRFTLAPHKGLYLRQNWLTAVSLLLPALRVLRLARVLSLARFAPTVRGVRLAQVVTSLNRGMQALGAAMQRRGFGYVLALTVLVVFAGAAGMYSFEQETPNGRGFEDYASALWWTAMLLTSIGSAYWPQTTEGRILCLILAIYGFAVFGYITATLASFFVGRDAADKRGEVAGSEDFQALREELAALREGLERLGLGSRE